MHPDNFKFNDGGRAAAGFKGYVGDCVPRAIAIATGKPYKEVYNDLFALAKKFKQTSRSAEAHNMKIAGPGSAFDPTPRTGVLKKVFHPYILSLGWIWTPTMFIGKGCTVHLTREELPEGRLIVSVSGHLTAVIDGVINDVSDQSRDGRRCVYGYYSKASPLV